MRRRGGSVGAGRGVPAAVPGPAPDEPPWDDPLPPPASRPGTPQGPAARIDADGLWRAEPHDDPRAVGVALRDATLTIADAEGRALAHWSLPAVERRGPVGSGPARYAPGAGSAESVEIADPAMVDALERVLRAMDERPPPRRRGGAVALALLLAAALGGAAAAPALLRGEVLRSAPPELRARVGEAVLARLAERAGPPCGEEAGLAALDRLAGRLAPALGSGARVAVLRRGPEAAVLPGGIAVLSRAALAGASGPDAVAGRALATAEDDALEALLRRAGVRETLRLLAAAEISDAALDAEAARLAAAPPEGPPPAERLPILVERFAAAGLSAAPYAEAVGAPGLAALDPHPGAAPALGAADWAALRGVCEG